MAAAGPLALITGVGPGTGAAHPGRVHGTGSGAQGSAVAYIVAVIDVPWTRKAYVNEPDEFFIKPKAIADELWHLANQDRSAWSFNVEVRPFRESW